MMLGFCGYVIFGEYGSPADTVHLIPTALVHLGLIIGCGYERVTKIIPLFVILYAALFRLRDDKYGAYQSCIAMGL